MEISIGSFPIMETEEWRSYWDKRAPKDEAAEFVEETIRQVMKGMPNEPHHWLAVATVLETAALAHDAYFLLIDTEVGPTSIDFQLSDITYIGGGSHISLSIGEHIIERHESGLLHIAVEPALEPFVPVDDNSELY